MATSVALALSVWKRSPSPMTCFQRANWPSTRPFDGSRYRAARPSALSRRSSGCGGRAGGDGVGGGAEHGIGAGWHDYLCIRMALIQGGVHPGSVIAAVAQEELHRLGDWSSRGSTCEASSTSRSVRMEATIRPVTASKPMWNLRQERRLLVPCFSTSHSPGPLSFRPELSTSRWIGSPVARGCAGSSSALGPPAEGGEVRHRQVEAEQLEDRADQSLGLAQRQMEHRAQCQSCRDRQVRVVGLTAWRRPRRRFPGGDGLIREPHGQTAPLPQRLVIRCPIRHASLRPRNVVAAVGIVFVRHEGRIRMHGTDRPPTPSRPSVHHLWTAPALQELLGTLRP